MSRLTNFSDEAGSHLLTTSTRQKRNLLQRTQWAELLEDVLFEYRDAGEYLVHHYVIMPNHFHLLATTARAERPSKIMQLIKGRFSFELKKRYGVQWSPWQEGLAGRQLRTPEQFAGAAQYIVHNPVRAGLCDAAEQYGFSSTNRRRVLDPIPEFGAEAPEERKGGKAMSPLKR